MRTDCFLAGAACAKTKGGGSVINANIATDKNGVATFINGVLTFRRDVRHPAENITHGLFFGTN
jgi:hypothetical protein